MAPPADTPREFRPGRRTQILDRRGKLLPLCEPADLPPGAPPRLRRAVRAANRHRWAYAARIVLLAIAFYLVARLLLGLATPKAGQPPVYLFIQVAAMALGSLFGAKQADAAGRTALSACLNASLCPSCCYSLVGITPEPDGMTTCPECGGVWPLAAPATPPGQRA